ncbi:uncharacterized protein EI90DRAFT_3018643 [Cantharellus anzutake]|uniref:uncharacterized protein n=1 Tax=Cantharellus anzutake TaxID=1750568 RepID=UPI001906AA63|nr:uncharacterized protein EI90DRAFT_3018643 [Cantharellus anzutake]KAF8326331.1 hypothetical protein EI90DRAFT_3018643 [Cantharellus anzutake]
MDSKPVLWLCLSANPANGIHLLRTTASCALASSVGWNKQLANHTRTNPTGKTATSRISCTSATKDPADQDRSASRHLRSDSSYATVVQSAAEQYLNRQNMHAPCAGNGEWKSRWVYSSLGIRAQTVTPNRNSKPFLQISGYVADRWLRSMKVLEDRKHATRNFVAGEGAPFATSVVVMPNSGHSWITWLQQQFTALTRAMYQEEEVYSPAQECRGSTVRDAAGDGRTASIGVANTRMVRGGDSIEQEYLQTTTKNAPKLKLSVQESLKVTGHTLLESDSRLMASQVASKEKDQPGCLAGDGTRSVEARQKLWANTSASNGPLGNQEKRKRPSDSQEYRRGLAAEWTLVTLFPKVFKCASSREDLCCPNKISGLDLHSAVKPVGEGYTWE